MDPSSMSNSTPRGEAKVREEDWLKDQKAEQEGSPASLETAAMSQDPTSSSPVARHWRLGLAALALIVLVALAGPSLLQRLGLTQPGYQPGSADAITLSANTAPGQMAADVPADVPMAAEVSGPAKDFEQVLTDYQSGRYREAWAGLRTIPAYQAALSTQPELTRAEQAVENEPSSAKAHFDLGTAWTRAQLFSLAEVAFKKAIALDDRYLGAYINLGVVYYHLHLLPEALAQYNAALAIDPNAADVHHNRGAILTQQAMQTSPPDAAWLEQAVQEFQRALELDPKLAPSHFSLGVIYNLRGQKAEAITEFRRFLELDTGNDARASQEAREYLQQLEQ